MSILDKLTRVLKKITPKEIAPILPMASMLIPGMQGLGPLMRYGLPQILAAAGSARTSGKINPLNQLMAAYASYAGGQPDYIDPATTTTKPNPLYNDVPPGELGGPGYIDPKSPLIPTKGTDYEHWFSTKPVETRTYSNADGRVFYGPKRTTYEGYPNMRTPESYYLDNLATDELANLPSNKLHPMNLPKTAEEIAADKIYSIPRHIKRISGKYGEALRDPFGSFGNFAAAAGPAVTATLGDQVLRKSQEDKSEEADRAATMDNYQTTMDNLVNTISEMGTNYNEIGGTPSPYVPYANAFNRKYGNQGGIMRTGYNMGGLGSIPQAPMVPQGQQLDGRGGGFIPMGAQEKRDDVPAMLAKNEFVMTSDAVRAAGGGSVEKGAQKMYDIMNQLEAQV